MFNLILVVFSSYTNKIGSIYLLFQDKKDKNNSDKNIYS
jgi:hypothetical protein